MNYSSRSSSSSNNNNNYSDMQPVRQQMPAFQEGNNEQDADDELPWIAPMEGTEPDQDDDLEQALELLLQGAQESGTSNNSQQKQSQEYYSASNNSCFGVSLEPRPLQQPKLPFHSGMEYGIPNQKVELRPITSSFRQDFVPKSRSVSMQSDDDWKTSKIEEIDHTGFFAGRSFNFMDDDKLNAYESKMIERDNNRKKHQQQQNHLIATDLAEV